MPAQNLKSARSIALTALNCSNPKKNFVSQTLDKLLPQTSEKQRATDLVFGTIRNRFAIDTAIAKLTDCPVKRIPPKILNIVRIAAYELIYCPQTPQYSIVNEAVENAKAAAGKKHPGFVNAILREITRHLQNRQAPLSGANTQKILPQTTSTGCQFDTHILPDPKTSPADYLSTAFSLPTWLINNWLDEFSTEPTQQICFASNRKPSIYIRPNTLKTTTAELSEKFHQENVNFETAPENSMLKIKAPQAIEKLPGFTDGLFTVQDLSASLPVKILRPQRNWTILDLCAAPGTKTTQLAELTADSATIFATDIDTKRLKMVKENISRLGINSVTVIEYKQLEQKVAQTGPFDCILLDVPCSNTGVLAKRIEARHRITPKTIKKLTKTQLQLLDTAAAMIKPHGKICYTTCSIQPGENTQLIKNFLNKNPNLELESELPTLPSAQSFDHDGGYAAILTAK